jgi:hypothetical protein
MKPGIKAVNEAFNLSKPRQRQAVLATHFGSAFCQPELAIPFGMAPRMNVS